MFQCMSCKWNCIVLPTSHFTFPTLYIWQYQLFWFYKFLIFRWFILVISYNVFFSILSSTCFFIDNILCVCIITPNFGHVPKHYIFFTLSTNIYFLLKHFTIFIYSLNNFCGLVNIVIFVSQSSCLLYSDRFSLTG